jgi:hypothetical protein
MVVGDSVKVLYPFNEPFPGVYIINTIQDTTCWLDGIESAFDMIYLEKV